MVYCEYTKAIIKYKTKEKGVNKVEKNEIFIFDIIYSNNYVYGS